ncbi:hypothetical protein GCM10027258_70700 [Amycolatopsis stemonae]
MTATANAAPAANHGTYLLRGDVLAAGDYITSGDHNFTLEMQADGNLVEYWLINGKHACWASNTNGWPGSYATYQRDGNLVVYTGGGEPLWASNTVGDRGTTVDISSGSLQDYGSLYVGYTRIHYAC